MRSFVAPPLDGRHTPRSGVGRRLLLTVALALPGTGCHALGLAPSHPGVAMRPVEQPVIAPFSSICRLEVRRRQVNGLVTLEHSALATGALLNAGHLLTAAHSFSSPPHMPVTGRAVECGRMGNNSLWSNTGPFRRQHLHVVPEHEGLLIHDYAVVRTGEALSPGKGFRLPREGEAALRRGDTVHVAGYALDHQSFDGKRLYHAVGLVRATSQDSSSFIYDVETHGGMSGSPVWVVRRSAEGEPEYVIVGVHVGRHYAARRLWALARRISGDALSNVQGWMAADSARGWTPAPRR